MSAYTVGKEQRVAFEYSSDAAARCGREALVQFTRGRLFSGSLAETDPPCRPCSRADRPGGPSRIEERDMKELEGDLKSLSVSRSNPASRLTFRDAHATI